MDRVLEQLAKEAEVATEATEAEALGVAAGEAAGEKTAAAEEAVQAAVVEAVEAPAEEEEKAPAVPSAARVELRDNCNILSRAPATAGYNARETRHRRTRPRTLRLYGHAERAASTTLAASFSSCVCRRPLAATSTRSL